MKIFIKKFPKKYFFLVLFFFLLYFASWFIWISHFTESIMFFSRENVRVYYYEVRCYSILKFFGSKNTDKLVNLVQTVRKIYSPLEIVFEYFDIYNISTKSLKEYIDLKKFNELSEKDKLKQSNILNNIKDYLMFLNDEELFSFYSIHNEYYNHSIIVFSPSINDVPAHYNSDIHTKEYLSTIKYPKKILVLNMLFHFTTKGDYLGPDSQIKVYFSFKQNEQYFNQSKKFVYWCNKLNITKVNPNFDPDFVDKYWKYANETPAYPW